jgi:hypothetical protein
MWPTIKAIRALGGSGGIDEIVEKVVELEGLTEEQQAVLQLAGNVWVDGGYAGRFVRDGQRIWRLVIEIVASCMTTRPCPRPTRPWSGPPASGPSAAEWPDDRIQRHALSLHRLAPSHPNGSR